MLNCGIQRDSEAYFSQIKDIKMYLKENVIVAIPNILTRTDKITFKIPTVYPSSFFKHLTRSSNR